MDEVTSDVESAKSALLVTIVDIGTDAPIYVSEVRASIDRSDPLIVSVEKLTEPAGAPSSRVHSDGNDIYVC